MRGTIPQLPAPLRTEPFPTAQAAQSRLGQLGARYVKDRGDGSRIFLAASGHYVRAVTAPRGINLEFYPAGCAC